VEWVGLYKLARLGFLAGVLVAIGLWLFAAHRRERLEAPALRMLEDDDLPLEERG
jgi:cbb3-type cytochrome oxidase subunit 3